MVYTLVPFLAPFPPPSLLTQNVYSSLRGKAFKGVCLRPNLPYRPLTETTSKHLPVLSLSDRQLPARVAAGSHLVCTQSFFLP